MGVGAGSLLFLLPRPPVPPPLLSPSPRQLEPPALPSRQVTQHHRPQGLLRARVTPAHRGRPCPPRAGTGLQEAGPHSGWEHTVQGGGLEAEGVRVAWQDFGGPHPSWSALQGQRPRRHPGEMPGAEVTKPTLPPPSRHGVGGSGADASPPGDGAQRSWEAQGLPHPGPASAGSQGRTCRDLGPQAGWGSLRCE